MFFLTQPIELPEGVPLNRPLERIMRFLKKKENYASFYSIILGRSLIFFMKIGFAVCKEFGIKCKPISMYFSI